MLDVFLTVDTEIWCDGWNNIDKKFPDAFSRYIYGKTPRGDYGLPFQLKTLNDHNLKAVFFVEPLFATRFGLSPLEEIVAIIQEAGQEVQMHLHTEWADEADTPLFPAIKEKRQHLKYFSLEEQKTLISVGLEWLNNAGSNEITAFRAGSFAANNDSLEALEANQIYIDSSYNATFLDSNCDIKHPGLLHQAEIINAITEYPMSIFCDYKNHYRHAQLGACSYAELSSIILQAYEKKMNSFVLLFHNFELLNREKNKPNAIVIKRFEKLCAFLDHNRAQINTQHFTTCPSIISPSNTSKLSSSPLKTAHRIAEQLVSRLLF